MEFFFFFFFIGLAGYPGVGACVCVWLSEGAYKAPGGCAVRFPPHLCASPPLLRVVSFLLCVVSFLVRVICMPLRTHARVAGRAGGFPSLRTMGCGWWGVRNGPPGLKVSFPSS